MADNKNNVIEKEYEELVIELKKELPNIVLPSMGRLEDSQHIDINGKDFVVSDRVKEV